MEKRIVRAVKRVGRIDRTYNLRIADNHNYFANGVLVHNCDDPNSAKDTSDAKLDTVLEWWNYVMPTRLNDLKTGRRIVVQQRVHEKDITGEILKNDVDGDWVKLILPMEFEEKRRAITVKLPSTKGEIWKDPRRQEGELLWPERIGRKELKKLKKELKTEYAVSGQLQQRPSPGEGGIIKKKWFQWWRNPEPPQVDFTMLSVDTAMSEEKESAMSAATTWGIFEHPEFKFYCIILLSTWRDNVGYPELRERIIRLSNHYLDNGPIYNPDGTQTKPLKPRSDRKPNMVLIEAKNNGISLIQELSRSEINVIRFNPDKLGDKTMRVRLITPLLESKKVWVPALPLFDAGSSKYVYTRLRPFADEFVEHCGNFPKAESRDLVDTMTQALWRFEQGGYVTVSGDPEPEPAYTNPGGQSAEAIY
jgi:phage terminase large subunit-like protein